MNIINLPKIEDHRGNLSFIESMRHIPFTIKRAFWIYDVAGGIDRDGHAFLTGEEFIIALSGSVDVVLNDGSKDHRFQLNRSFIGLHVAPMTWRKMENFATNTVVLVLASNLYDPSDYIEQYNHYKLLSTALQLNPSVCPALPINKEAPSNEKNLSQFSQSTINDCSLIDLQKVHTERGTITVVEELNQVPFSINRAYYLYDIPSGATRGGHAHYALYQLIIAGSGSFDVIINDGTNERRITMNRPNEALLIVPGIWRTLDNFSSGSVSLVLASHFYAPDDYIYDFNSFTHQKKGMLL